MHQVRQARLKTHRGQQSVLTYFEEACLILTEGVLGDDTLLRLQRLGLSFGVDSHDAELVLVSGLQVVEVDVRILGAARWHPPSGFGVEFLHRVILDRRAAVIVRRAPLQRTALLVDVRDLQRTFRLVRLVCEAGNFKLERFRL